MVALIAGFLLVGYLLAPGAIYRLFFSIYISSKRFQRTRTEEVVFSVLVTLVPFAISWYVLLHTPIGRWPALTSGLSKHDAYVAVLNSVLPGGDTPHALVGQAYLRSFGEQARFLVCLWFGCAVEGWIASILVKHYGDYGPSSLFKRFCDKVLLRHVSEWELLFTTLAQPAAERHLRVEVDALTTMNILYRGRLDDWFVDTDGKLAGIYLVQASRYARELLELDRAAGNALPAESYWRPIPGAQLYLVASTVANYNIRYVDPEHHDTRLAGDLLGQDIVITPLPAEDTED